MMKVKAREKNGVTKVKMLVRHPMETGRVKDAKTGELIPAHFIQELTCAYQDKVVFTAQMGVAVSKNPYLAFAIKGAKKSEMLKFKWLDNLGKTEEVEVAIS